MHIDLKQARSSFFILVIGVIAVVVAVYSPKQSNVTETSLKEESANQAVNQLRMRSIEQAIIEGKHEYSFITEKAPPPISP